jgi:hypothetical protein
MTQQVLTQVSRIKYPWLLGQQQDLLFFIVPTIIAFVVYAFIAAFPSLYAATVVFTLFYAVNVAHQASTYFHFADQRNRKYYFGTAKQCFKFIVLPIALLAVSIAAGFVYFQLVIAAWFIWSIPHVVQQNTGILLLYHNPRTGEAIVPRDLEILTIRFSTLFFVLVAAYRGWLPLFSSSAFSKFYLVALSLVFVAFVTSVVLYLIDLHAQIKNGATFNAPAFFFWILCLSFYMPVAVTQNSLALLLPSILHFVQYIGLNSMMVRRKYNGEQAQFLSLVSSERIENSKMSGFRFFVYFTLAVVFVQYGLYLLCLYLWPQVNYMNVWNSAFLGLGMVHYLLDGFIWKFREEYNRKAILPYLVSTARRN